MKTYHFEYLQGEEFADRGFGPPYKTVMEGEIDGISPMAACEKLWVMNNRDDRPKAQEIRSMSMGDVVVLDRATAYRAEAVGWEEVEDWGSLPLAGEVSGPDEQDTERKEPDMAKTTERTLTATATKTKDTKRQYRYDLQDDGEFVGSLYLPKDGTDTPPNEIKVTVNYPND